MIKKYLSFIDSNFGPLFILWCRNTIYTAPVFESLFAISLIIIKLIFMTNLSPYIMYDISLHDTGTMFSLLLYLEHMFITYYLIIILFMVYWTLYSFILDFLGWSFKYNGLFSFIYNYIFNIIIIIIFNIYYKIKNIIINVFLILKDLEFLLFLTNNNENKTLLNNKNILNKFGSFFKHFDNLGRSIILINYGSLKILLNLNLITEYLSLLQQKINFNTLNTKKLITKFLFYNKANAYFFSNIKDNNLYIKKANYSNLIYSDYIYNLRNIYKDMFLVNQFKHSGIFEAVWAIFPTCIIFLILIPSLILLYSFEDILNPRMTVKVIGNQWYWTYEFDNYLKLSNNEEDNFKFVSVNYSFDSRIIDTNDLNFGTKRLLEVDNRLVLPTNVTIRFLITSTDVLHSFAMPGLGFKVDANPGRLNQILVFISRPGVYYGQCSELCGANHGFMPIVIQSIMPEKYSDYLKKFNNI